MKIILTGASGQLGQALINNVPQKDFKLIQFSRKELDLADSLACYQLVKEFKPDWLINAGAYTAVDKAEKEPDLAYLVNAEAPKAFASALSDIGAKMIQISTDFVFSGKQGFPYKINQCVDPLGVYGSSKAAGEQAVLNCCPGSSIIRTSWLYSGIRQNFCLTMLRMHSLKSSLNEPLSVVSDQVGCPTSTDSLAIACWRTLFLDNSFDKPSILHWSDSGVASWYDFAVAIGQLGVENGLLKKSAIVKPINTDEYPTPAKRPSYSLLDCSETRKLLDLEPKHWRKSLSDVLQQLRLSLQ